MKREAPSFFSVLMAGGEGTRFAPLSTPEKPKQFLSFFNDESFLQQAYKRLIGVADPRQIYVTTQERYRDLVHEQLPDILPANIIAEPLKKNTAPSIAYITRYIAEKTPQALIGVFPADHVIGEQKAFQHILRQALSVALREQVIVALTISPTSASSAYGYLKLLPRPQSSQDDIYDVAAFVEKPSQAKAKQFIDHGDYVWNAGIFIFTAQCLLNELKSYAPQLSKLLEKFDFSEAFRRSFFEEAEAISIDYAVMERTKNILALRASFPWSDIGTWEGLKHFSEKNQWQLRPEIKNMMHHYLGEI